ncbi:hypothetical protein HDV05_005919 [Chytridiales sp. JEL 0842]|nr:hypothetical protein HDV05_005919 [Chytridiales sp. JEL 0842]
METEPLLDQEEPDIWNEEDEEELLGDPRSPPRYIDPSHRRFNSDMPFALLYALALSVILITGINTMLTAKHEDGDYLRKTLYAALHNTTIPIVAVTSASLVGGFLWILFMSAFVKTVVWGTILAIPVLCLGLFTFVLTDSILGKVEDRPGPLLDWQFNMMIAVAGVFLLTGVGTTGYFAWKRKHIDKTIHIIQFATEILWENPAIFLMSFCLMAVYMGFTALWIIVVSHFFLSFSLSLPSASIPPATQAIVIFYVFVFFWTSAILHNIEKTTIAGVVGRWYFKGNENETHTKNQTLRNLKAALTTGFGTICFASLILAVVKTVQALVKYLRKPDELGEAAKRRSVVTELLHSSKERLFADVDVVVVVVVVVVIPLGANETDEEGMLDALDLILRLKFLLPQVNKEDMADRAEKLAKLAEKRKAEAAPVEKPKQVSHSTSSKPAPSASAIAKKEAELEKKLAKELKGKNQDAYDKGDGFVVDSDEEEEESDVSGESESEDERPKKRKSSSKPAKKSAKHSDSESEESEEEDSDESPKKKKKKVDKKVDKKKSKKVEKKKSKKKKGSDDSDDDLSVEDESDDDLLNEIDTSQIITSGRRTRGKKIDYTQFGPDDEDDE